MQKIRLWLVATCLCLISACFTGCSNVKSTPQELEPEKEEIKEKQEIALVSDLGTINDNSFNQASWDGIKKYAKESGVLYKNYQPQEGTVEAYVENIELAIDEGAKIIICPGYNFETPVYLMQDKYPDTTFILLDGEPYDAAYSESKIGDNVLSIWFQEEQAGFLAGYAAVKDGYNRLGFIGGMAVPSVVRYGYGFVQGCELAAKEKGIKVEISYTYAGTFTESEATKSMALDWYQSGTQVIFACGGAIGNTVIKAAEQVDGKVIGVDEDQSNQSKTVITSAMKMVSLAVYQTIKEYYAGNFNSGVQKFSVTNDGIGLPMDTSTFRVFSKEDYEHIYAKLVAGDIEIINKVDVATTQDLALEAATICFIH